MRGFADRALILFSDPSYYNEALGSYKNNYRRAVQNLLTYLESIGVEHDCLLTDQLAVQFNLPNTRWIATAVPEDLFFMRNYCNIPNQESTPLPDALATKLRTKYPVERGLSPEDRFAIVAKRTRMAERNLIDSYKFVVVFGNTFRVRTKESDGRAVFSVNDKRFYTRMELSGAEVPISDFLQIPYGNLSLCDWGLYNGACTRSSN